MGGVRRSWVAALAALAALLLLLLARLPPPARPPRPPPPAPVVRRPPPSSSPVNHTAPPTTRRSTPLQTKSPKSAPASASSPPAAKQPPPAVVEASTPRPVLTREVYVAGHERPHPEICPALGAKVKLVILITSAPSHRSARDAIRLTWGHYATRSDVALAFVLGAPPASLRAAVAAEDELYNDMVVGRSVDSYSNMTLKTLSILEWVDTYCPRAPKLLKTDDDMFINVQRLLEFAAAPGRANATMTIWGKVIKKSLPKRTTRSKYFVSPVQFPGKVFPDFATGPAYLVTADAVRPLLAAAPGERYLRLEDVFVTGVLAARLGLKRRHAPEFYNKKLAMHPCAVQRAISIHMVRYHEQFELWRRLLDGKTKCT